MILAGRRQGRLDQVAVLVLLAQGPLLLASSLLGAALSMQAGVTAARATLARAEQQVVVTSAEVEEAEARLERLRESTFRARDLAAREETGLGPSGTVGRGPNALRLRREAALLEQQMEAQEDLVERLAADDAARAEARARDAQAERRRAGLAAEDQERVARDSLIWAGTSLALALALSVCAEVLRSRRRHAVSVESDRWQAGLAASIERLHARLDSHGRALSGLRRADRRQRGRAAR